MTSWAATRRRLDADRWHFAHGPIDLVIGADGEPAACSAAHDEAWARFGPVLETLIEELPLLRTPCPTRPDCAPAPVCTSHGTDADGGSRTAVPCGPVAAQMYAACTRLACATGLFITPMAAVAGAVADHLIACYRRPGVRRAYVNNGGDIALHLDAGARYRLGIVADLDAPALDAAFDLDGSQPLRGVASSGWRGRSLSMGIADTVTVVANDAASADAAATLIANVVNVNDPAIERAPASSVRDDSDLGDRLVTVSVGPLSEAQVDAALDAGEVFAARLIAGGLIDRAGIVLARRWRVIDRSKSLHWIGD